jgi:hypothetical protein
VIAIVTESAGVWPALSVFHIVVVENALGGDGQEESGDRDKNQGEARRYPQQSEIRVHVPSRSWR